MWHGRRVFRLWEKRAMLALKIRVNGKAVRTIGYEGGGALHADLSIQQFAPETNSSRKSVVLLNLMAVAIPGPRGEHLEWPSRQLALGDVVTMEIVDVEKVNKPRRRRLPEASPEEVEQAEARQRKLYEELRQKYGE